MPGIETEEVLVNIRNHRDQLKPQEREGSRVQKKKRGARPESEVPERTESGENLSEKMRKGRLARGDHEGGYSSKGRGQVGEVWCCREIQ